MSQALYSNLRLDVLPTPFCTGCGHGILMGAIVRAINDVEYDWDKMLFVSGIGCAAWISSPHFNADTLHTTHGRPIAFATGALLANPELKVVVISGDGDLTAIGGNHLIHAARRNLPLTVICADNETYGMTGGQAAPTTSRNSCTQTTPWGSSEPAFDLCKLVEGAGATFIARRTVFQVRALIKTLTKAFEHKGFSFVDAISPCTTHYGKMNKTPMIGDFKEDLKDVYIDKKKWSKLSAEERYGKIPTGEWITAPLELERMQITNGGKPNEKA